MIKKLMLRSGTALLLAGFMFLSGTGMNMAQEKSPSVKFNLFSVKGLVVGKLVRVDAKYGKRFNAPIPAPFSITVPSRQGATPLYRTADKPGSGLLTVIFATGNRKTAEENRKFIENLLFVNLTLPMGDKKKRMQLLANVLVKKIYKKSIAKFPKNKLLGVKKTTIGNYDAIELIGKYLDAGNQLTHLRIVGIPNPESPNSIFVISNVTASFYSIEDSNELANTMSGNALNTFKYLKQK